MRCNAIAYERVPSRGCPIGIRHAGVCAIAEQAVPIKAGQKAPAFDLESSTGERIRLANFAGKRDVVLYFYPKADTPGCTKQACAFRDARAAYEKANVAVLGI